MFDIKENIHLDYKKCVIFYKKGFYNNFYYMFCST